MRKYILLGLIVALTASCSNFLEEYSQDLSKVESYTDLDELLIGDGYWRLGRMYVESSSVNTENDFLQALHLMTDELEIFRKTSSVNYYVQEDYFGYITWQRQVGRTYKGETINAEDKDWNELYKRINVANQVISEIDEQHAADEEEELEKTRIKGEAHFLRAIYYFTLVNMYARPYHPETADNEPGIPIKRIAQIEDKLWESSPLSEVYEYILEDLRVARECLRQTEAKNHPYRADIVAALLLTSRVHLYMQDWQEAYNYADSVLQRKGDLEDLNARAASDTTNILTRSSVETIFSMGGHVLAPLTFETEGTDSWTGDPMVVPTFCASDDLVNLYGEEGDDSDLRRGFYIRQVTPIAYGVQYEPEWVFNKVNGPDLYASGEYCEVGDFFLMRTAEAYLNAAEAAAQLGNDGEAVSLLKQLRSSRVKADNANYGSGSQLVNFVRDERERELCLEGHRWFDLRRYTVDAQYPYSKEITHYFTDFNAERDPVTGSEFVTTVYTLAENDPAYTLALPKEVTDFQPSLPSVSRPDRPGTAYDEFEGLDFEALGQADGYRAGVAVGTEDKEAGAEHLPDDYNPNYYRYFNGDYDQFDVYAEAYSIGFEEGYNEAYQEETGEGESEDWLAGYADGFAAGRVDFAAGVEYGDGYNDLWDNGDYDFDEYNSAFEEGYADALKTPAEKGAEDGAAMAQWEIDHDYAFAETDDFYWEEGYATQEEKDEYYDAFWEAYDNLMY